MFTLMSFIVEIEPSSVEEADTKQVWWDAMIEEYNSILKSNVYEIVPIYFEELVIDSKHGVDESNEEYAYMLLPKDSLRKRELTLIRLFL